MEEHKALKFVCKWCHKKYPCGKSLGGHMKSHVIAISAESEKKVEPYKKKISSSSSEGQHNSAKESEIVEFVNGGQSNYVLRENPKKTWRAAADSTSLLPQERVCKHCGKGFQSLKALCGHMASHSDKDKGLKDDQSWSAENQKLVLDSYSDNEAEYQLLKTRWEKGKKCTSSVSEWDRQEQEEVAVCLMLLSMDFMNKDCVNSVLESSDNFSVVLETKSSSTDMKIGDDEGINHVCKRNEALGLKKIGDEKIKHGDLDAEIPKMENSDSAYFLDECVKAESDVSVGRLYGKHEEHSSKFKNRLSKNKISSCRTELRKELVMENWYGNSDSAMTGSRKGKCSPENVELGKKSGRKMKDVSPEAETSKHPQKRSKYECFNCKRTFKSFQALGGHRPCHKRSSVYETVYESDENYLDDSADMRPNGKTGEGSSNRGPAVKNAGKKANPSRNKGHVCPFCQRVFKNGQALGGHKRSHFIGSHSEDMNLRHVVKPKLLDLNLPPDEAEDDGR